TTSSLNGIYNLRPACPNLNFTKTIGNRIRLELSDIVRRAQGSQSFHSTSSSGQVELGVFEDRCQGIVQQIEGLLEYVSENPLTDAAKPDFDPFRDVIPLIKLIRVFLNKLSKPTNNKPHPLLQMNPISLSAFLQSAALVPDQIEIFLYRIKMDHECNVKIDWEKVFDILDSLQCPIKLLEIQYLDPNGTSQSSHSQGSYHEFREWFSVWYAHHCLSGCRLNRSPEADGIRLDQDIGGHAQGGHSTQALTGLELISFCTSLADGRRNRSKVHTRPLRRNRNSMELMDLGVFDERCQEIVHDIDDLLQYASEEPLTKAAKTDFHPFRDVIPLIKLTRLFLNKLSRPTNNKPHPLLHMSPQNLSEFLKWSAPLPGEIGLFLYRIKLEHTCGGKIDWLVVFDIFQCSHGPFEIVEEQYSDPHGNFDHLNFHIKNFRNGLAHHCLSGCLLSGMPEAPLIGLKSRCSFSNPIHPFYDWLRTEQG
ncbi:hypothetical protein PSHT_10220, partial [Puccinia striiformis]